MLDHGTYSTHAGLSTINICMSHTSTLATLDALTIGFDDPVKNWSLAVQENLQFEVHHRMQ